jgi:hypothetical protein
MAGTALESPAEVGPPAGLFLCVLRARTSPSEIVVDKINFLDLKN